jgi:hypothetical protein
MMPAVGSWERRRLRRLLPALAVSALLASCGGEPIPCTQIGCTSGVSVTVEGFGVTVDDGVAVRACLDSECRSRTITEEPAVIPLEVDRTASESTVTLSVRVSRGDEVLVEADEEVTLHKISPNGDQCGPICYVSFVVLSPAGLRQA